jgi:hypothetical protein
MKASIAFALCLLAVPATSRALDPTGPQHVAATASEPALTLELPGADAPLNTRYATTLVRLERRTPAGAYVDAPWLMNGFRAEQGITFDYNTFNRYAYTPEVPSLPVGEALGSNTADHGNLGLGGMDIDWYGAGILAPAILDRDEGGVWLGSAAGGTANVDLGVDGTTPAPGAVVVLSRTAGGSITLTSTPGARGPLVVTALQNGRALVAVAGVVAVASTGPIRAGDFVATSGTPGLVQRALPGTAGTSILGSAIASPQRTRTGHAVQVRIATGQMP